MAEYLWSKAHASASISQAAQQFACGDDLACDRLLLPFDIRGSLAHARGLERIGILDERERQSIEASLRDLQAAFERGEFVLEPPAEDCHSAIEAWLSDRLGELGRKIHAGRSRNDQVQLAMRLYLRDRLDRYSQLVIQIAEVMLVRAEDGESTPMPGYTHLQRAVPSTLEHWFAGYAEAFIDIAWLAKLTADWVQAMPLGTAAGYGVNLPLDRDWLTKELEFDRLQLNPQYVQNSRGRFEFQVVACIAQSTMELRRLAWDLSLFCCEEFGFARVSDRYSTGSSIMPNKRNPDIVELMRGHHAIVQGAISEIQATLSLPAGYHRDLQLTKSATMRAIEPTLLALQLVPDLVRELRFDPKRMSAAISPEMLTTDVVNDRVKQGMPFRDAYRQPPTADELRARDAQRSIHERKSLGAPGNLGIDRLRARLASIRQAAGDASDRST